MAEDKCYICGKILTYGISGAIHGGKCRICDHYFCSTHIHDGICRIDKEKMEGKR